MDLIDVCLSGASMYVGACKAMVETVAIPSVSLTSFALDEIEASIHRQQKIRITHAPPLTVRGTRSPEQCRPATRSNFYSFLEDGQEDGSRVELRKAGYEVCPVEIDGFLRYYLVTPVNAPFMDANACPVLFLDEVGAWTKAFDLWMAGNGNV